MDRHIRSVAKALSWRFIGTIITGAVAWAITRKASLGVAIGLADTAIKLGVYYAHERAWNRIRFGRVEPPEYEI